MKLTIALTLLSLPALPAADWKPAESPLTTPWTAMVNPDHALPEYPRPQMARKDWINLNGLWDYAIRPQQETAPAKYDGRILVPFPVESALSGVKQAAQARAAAMVSPHVHGAQPERQAAAAAFRRGGLARRGVGQRQARGQARRRL